MDKSLAQTALEEPRVKRLMTITGVNSTVAMSVLAAIGDIHRFSSPEKFVSYFGLNPRVRQSGDKPPYHGRITKAGRAQARSMLVEAAWVISSAPGPLRAFFIRIRDNGANMSLRWQPRAVCCRRTRKGVQFELTNCVDKLRER